MLNIQDKIHVRDVLIMFYQLIKNNVFKKMILILIVNIDFIHINVKNVLMDMNYNIMKLLI